MLNTIINFAKNNEIAIKKGAGIVCTIAGTILAASAGEKQQKIEIAKAVDKHFETR